MSSTSPAAPIAINGRAAAGGGGLRLEYDSESQASGSGSQPGEELASPQGWGSSSFTPPEYTLGQHTPPMMGSASPAMRFMGPVTVRSQAIPRQRHHSLISGDISDTILITELP